MKYKKGKWKRSCESHMGQRSKTKHQKVEYNELLRLENQRKRAQDD